MDLACFAEQISDSDPVAIVGQATRGGAIGDARRVTAPTGIDWLKPDEMTASCAAGTSVQELSDALANVGQFVALPPGGTVGGALAVGHSGIRRLGDGPIRDVLLQARYVSSHGRIVKAGGPTVKNVSGFDLCRLLVGSRGTIGFLGDVILRTRPLARATQWFVKASDAPEAELASIYRPVSMLWNGATLWVLLEGHPGDVHEQARRCGLTECGGPPVLPIGRSSVRPSQVTHLQGTFVAEVGVGIVHGATPSEAAADSQLVARQATVALLTQRVKHQFDPTGRLNPGVGV